MTGARLGEAAALHWRDIDFDTGMVNIDKSVYYKNMGEYRFVEPKTRASIRKIYIDEDTIAELKLWKEAQHLLN